MARESWDKSAIMALAEEGTMIKKWSNGLIGIFLCFTLLPGCLGAAVVGAGATATGAVAGYNWMSGALTMQYPRALPEMDQAVQQVCKDYRIKITDRRIDPSQGVIYGVDPNGDNVVITLQSMPNNITSVGVRVGGFMGNRDASEMFHKQLQKNLGL
jgi:hypothetical protein